MLDGTPPQSILYVAVFQNDLPSWKAFPSRQDEVYFIGGGAAGGL